MATVYVAQDLKHERTVALKVLKPELAAVLGAERFVQEIKTTASLQHPNILPLFDSGEATGFLYYVMPYIEGETLRDRLDRERQLPVDEAVQLTTQVAEALDYAHRRGVIHRDIKPENVLVQEGRPMVADFGIALAVSAAAGGRMTETGLSLGTPHYMSPEQATAERDLTSRSDIYSLGVVLYEMLTGDPPHTGSTVQQIVMKIVSEEAESVTTVRKSVPPHVAAALAKALEKLPADRFGSAAELARALGDTSFRHGAGAGAAAAAPTRTRALATAGWVAAMALGGTLVVTSLTPDAPLPVRRLSLAVPDGSGPSALALTPDGSALILAGSQDTAAAPSLYVQRLDDLVRTAVPESEDPIDMGASPDGLNVVFGTPTGLYLAPLAGGASRTLADDVTWPCCIRWGENGYIYYSDDGTIRRVRAAGGNPEPVLQGDGLGFYHYQPVGDGDRAIVVAAFDGPARIEWVDIATGRRRIITEGDRPRLTAGGYLVYDRDNAIYAARLDLSSMEVLDGPVRMVERIAASVDARFTLSESGDLAYWVSQVDPAPALEVVWVDREGGATVVDPDWTDAFESVEISPSGSHAAVTVGSMDPTEVWLKELGGGPARRLTSYQGMNRRPVWAPDGRSLTFISNRSGSRAVYSVPVDGIAAPELLLEHPGKDVDEVSWSADADWLIYRTGTAENDRDIFARRLRPDTVTIVVSAQADIDERAPVLSPDGRWLAYVSNQTGRDEVWIRPFPDVARGSRMISVEGGTEPVWSGSGDELFFRSSTGLWSVEVRDATNFSSGAPRQLFTTDGYVGSSLHRAYAYDGRSDRFLMIRTARRDVPAQLILIQNFMEDVKARLGN